MIRCSPQWEKTDIRVTCELLCVGCEIVMLHSSRSCRNEDSGSVSDRKAGLCHMLLLFTVTHCSSLSSVCSHFLSCQHFMSVFCLHGILLEAEMCQQTVKTHLIQTQQSLPANLALI